MVHGPAFAAQQHMEAPIAVGHARLGQLRAAAVGWPPAVGRHARVPHARARDAASVETAYASCTQRPTSVAGLDSPLFVETPEVCGRSPRKAAALDLLQRLGDLLRAGLARPHPPRPPLAGGLAASP